MAYAIGLRTLSAVLGLIGIALLPALGLGVIPLWMARRTYKKAKQKERRVEAHDELVQQQLQS